MRTRRPFLRLFASGVVGLALVLVLVPVVTGRPVVSYPVSGSMVPTLGPFDVFFVDPWPGALHKGDIIVFDSVTRAQPAVHRIVGGDESGWITQGDANPNADQMAGEPAVTRDRVLGRVVTWPSGEPVKVPGLGVTATEVKVEATRLHDRLGGDGSLTPVLLAAGGALLVLSAMARPRRRAPPSRPLPRGFLRGMRRAFPRGVLGRHVALALLLLLAGAGAWSAHQARTDVALSMVVVQDPGAADPYRSAPPGGALDRQLQVGSLGILPTTVIVEPGSPRVAVPDPAGGVAAWSTTAMTAKEIAGPSTGYQEDSVHVWRYPALLPRDIIVALHRAAPGSPDLVLAGLCALAGALWFRALGVADRPVGRWLGIREEWI